MTINHNKEGEKLAPSIEDCQYSEKKNSSKERRIKMRNRYFKRVLSIILAVSMVLTSFPVYAAPAKEDLSEQMRNAVSDEDYPNGLLNFGETQLSVKEGDKTTIKVVRQGNTDNEATVHFKAIDISAKYGADYLLTVVHSSFKKEQLEENEDAVPLMEEQAEIAGGDMTETDAESTEESAQTEDSTTEAPETVPEDADSSVNAARSAEIPEGDTSVSEEASGTASTEALTDAPAADLETAPLQTTEAVTEITDVEAVSQVTEEAMTEQNTSEEDIDEVQITEDVSNEETDETPFSKAEKKSGLRAAYQVQMNREVPTNDWKETNPENISSDTKDTMDNAADQTVEYFKETEGEETVLTFKPGEYMKEIEVETIDDDKSESEEQFVFVIYDAEGTEIGANYNGFVNIQDNDEAEDNVFGMKDKYVVVSPDSDVAKVTIVRSSGIDQMAFVTVGTKEIDAQADKDYESGMQELLFPAGVKEKTVEIPIKGDRLTDKSFYVGISSNGVITESGNSAAIVTIKAAEQSAAETEGDASDISADISAKATGYNSTPSYTKTSINSTWTAINTSSLDLRLADSIKVNYTVKGSKSVTKCGKTTEYKNKRVELMVASSKSSANSVLTGAKCDYTETSQDGSIEYSRDLKKDWSKWSDLRRAYIFI